uniref:Uncharacterized protein n=1 Tax=Hucho hucho TaxID=62062 RepID=A0A4W5P4N5_9TELE
MPGDRRGPSRWQLRRSALPSLHTPVGSSHNNGYGPRNRSSNCVSLSALITAEPVRHSRIPDLPLDTPAPSHKH